MKLLGKQEVIVKINTDNKNSIIKTITINELLNLPRKECKILTVDGFSSFDIISNVNYNSYKVVLSDDTVLYLNNITEIIEYENNSIPVDYNYYVCGNNTLYNVDKVCNNIFRSLNYSNANILNNFVTKDKRLNLSKLLNYNKSSLESLIKIILNKYYNTNGIAVLEDSKLTKQLKLLSRLFNLDYTFLPYYLNKLNKKVYVVEKTFNTTDKYLQIKSITRLNTNNTRLEYNITDLNGNFLEVYTTSGYVVKQLKD